MGIFFLLRFGGGGGNGNRVLGNGTFFFLTFSANSCHCFAVRSVAFEDDEELAEAAAACVLRIDDAELSKYFMILAPFLTG